MKPKFHLTHIVPNPALHIAHGYKEIIDSVQWGLASLGYEATYAINRGKNDAINIVFGASMLGLPALANLPRNTIVYNLEQMAGFEPEEINERIRFCADRFALWDYSHFNLPAWQALNPRAAVKHVPIGYAPILSRIDRSLGKDIDVLFYGGPGGDRLRVFSELCQSLVKTVFVHGLYGASRDGLIARSKLILNVSQYPRSRVFEIARVSYLFANRKAVVSDFAPESRIEDDIREAATLVAREDIVSECLDLLADERRREAIEQAGFECIRKRDIRTILAAAL